MNKYLDSARRVMLAFSQIHVLCNQDFSIFVYREASYRSAQLVLIVPCGTEEFSTAECVFQKLQLLRLNVPQLFMLVALDEGPGPPIKYQYAELSKLYAVVSHLVRCCDISHRCVSSISVSVLQILASSPVLFLCKV